MSADEPEVITAILQYIYTNDYQTRSLQTPPPSLLFLAKLYASADMHDVPGLQSLIILDFNSSLGTALSSEAGKLDFIEATHYTYENCVESDKSLRDAIVTCILRYTRDLFGDAAVAGRIRQVVHGFPEIAVHMALATTGVFEAGLNQRQQEQDDGAV